MSTVHCHKDVFLGGHFMVLFCLLRRKIDGKHFLSSGISPGCPFISPALMAVNYADKVSAAKAVSQKKRLVEVPIKFQENRGEYIEFSFHIPWVRNKAGC